MRNILEAKRHELGISYAEVARRSGYTTATVWKHCNGTLHIGEKAALRYHRRLGIPLDELLPEDQSRPYVYGDKRPAPVAQ